MALLFGRFRVEGASMVPLLASGQRLLVGRLPYILGRPDRGDIVVIRHPRRSEMLLVKQLVGLPGDDISVRGISLVQPDSDAPLKDPEGRAEDRTLRLGPREYFVAGTSGEDSRADESVPPEAIVGKVWFSYWPPVRLGVLVRSRLLVGAPAPGRSA